MSRPVGTAQWLRIDLAGSVVWALTMASSAALGLWTRGWRTDSAIATVAGVYALGALIAFPSALWLSRRLTSRLSVEGRFAAAFLIFTCATVGITAIIYALDYRSYYAAWHDDALTMTWFVQLAYTTAGALVQFAVSGTRLYFPLGFGALLALSLWVARTAR